MPASGNLGLCGQQFWLGPQLGGVAIMLWMDTTVVHIVRDGVRLKTVPSRINATQVRQLLADGGRIAGPPPLTAAATGPIEVDGLVNGCELVVWGSKTGFRTMSCGYSRSRSIIMRVGSRARTAALPPCDDQLRSRVLPAHWPNLTFRAPHGSCHIPTASQELAGRGWLRLDPRPVRAASGDTKTSPDSRTPTVRPSKHGQPFG